MDEFKNPTVSGLCVAKMGAQRRFMKQVPPCSIKFSENERWFVAKLGGDVWRHGILEFLLPVRRKQFLSALFMVVTFPLMHTKQTRHNNFFHYMEGIPTQSLSWTCYLKDYHSQNPSHYFNFARLSLSHPHAKIIAGKSNEPQNPIFTNPPMVEERIRVYTGVF